MRFRQFVMWLCYVSLVGGIRVGVAAQDYPNKPIRIVTSAPGGGVDFAARLIAPALTERFGQQVIVENRGGAGGMVAAQTVARAPPDGYTLLLYGSPIWLAPYLRKSVPYDPVKDFQPITLTTRSPTILVVHPSVAANSVKDLIALAKAKPGALNVAIGGSGTSSHLATELFKSRAAIDIVLVPYTGTGPAVSAVLGGEVRVMFANTAVAAPHVKSGKLRALAVTSTQPSALAPGVPTVATSGLPGYESVSIYGMLAPAKTPAAIISRLNQEVVRFLVTPQVKEKFLQSGVEVVASSPKEFAAAIKSDMTTLGKVIKEAGIRED